MTRPMELTLTTFDLMEYDYLGVVEPDSEGRWVWPLARMHPGQFFHVNKADRATGSVRNYVGVVADKYDKAFSVRANDPGKPGYTLVMCREPDNKARRPGKVQYGTAKALVKARYGYDLDDHSWGAEWGAMACDASTDRYQPPLTFEVAGELYGIEFSPLGFSIEKLAEGETLQSWQRRKEEESRLPEAARSRAELKQEIKDELLDD